MKSAIEKTIGSDAQARLKLSGKLQLLQTALLILDRSVKETSQEEYNALVHLGERIRSAVELYRAQTGKGAASRAAGSVPFAGPGPPDLSPSDPSWELPVDYISSLIAEERRRLGQPAQLHQQQQGGLSSSYPPPHHSQEGRVNPFMQQALALAQGGHSGSAQAGAAGRGGGGSPAVPSSPGGVPGTLSPRAQHAQHATGPGSVGGAVPLERPGHSYGHHCGSGSGGITMAFASAFYRGASGGGDRMAAAKRRAAALGNDDCEGDGEQDGAAQRSELPRRSSRSTKYRSVSFDEPTALRHFHAPPEGIAAAGFHGFWQPEEQQPAGGLAASSGDSPGAVASSPGRMSHSLPGPYHSHPVQGWSGAAAGLGLGTLGAALSPFASLAKPSEMQQQQQHAGVAVSQHELPTQGAGPDFSPGSGDMSMGSLGLGQISLGPGLSAGQLAVGPPAQEALHEAGQLPSQSPPIDVGADPVLQQRQRQWQQLLALRLAQQRQQQQDAACGPAPSATAATPQLPAPGSLGGYSVPQLLLQGLPPEEGGLLDVDELAAVVASGGVPSRPGSSLGVSTKRDVNSPASTTNSGTSRCSNEVPRCPLVPQQRQHEPQQRLSGEREPSRLLGIGVGGHAQPPSLPGGAALTAAAAKPGHSPPELHVRDPPLFAKDYPPDSLEGLLLEAAAKGGPAPCRGPSPPAAYVKPAAGLPLGSSPFELGPLPMDTAGRAASPPGGGAVGTLPPRGSGPLAASGLLPLTGSTYNTLAVQLQPSLQAWALPPGSQLSQRPAQQARQLQGKPPAPGQAYAMDGIHSGSGSVVGTAGGTGTPSSQQDTSCGLQFAQMGLGGSPHAPLAGAPGVAGMLKSGSFSALLSSTGFGSLVPNPLLGSSGVVGGPGRGASPTLVEPGGLSSLLFDLGPDFLPEFEEEHRQQGPYSGASGK
ncbi:hypothetical protein N2152v2_000117 [Parachlorella kessleri]